MAKKYILLFLLGLVLLVLQSTWLYGETIHPFRFDLVFILIFCLGTQERVFPGLILGFFLGLMMDILSWGGMGKAMILFPLIVWVTHQLWTRTMVQSIFFMVLTVFFLQIFYGFSVYFFQTLSSGHEFSRYLSFLIVVQAIITMLISLPLFYLFKTCFGKKPALS
ncbi:MAG: rod shape-determining protein MreD [Thermodesulfobacteriota bacterium]